MINIDELKNLYKVQKTITFELKNKWENKNDKNDRVEFLKTQEWVGSLFKVDEENFDEKESIPNLLDFGQKIAVLFYNLSEDIANKQIDTRVFKVSKFLLEEVDRNQYHKKKNKPIKVEEVSPNTNKIYIKDYKLSDQNTLYVLLKIMEDEGRGLQKFLNDKADRLNLYNEKVRRDFALKESNEQQKFSGNANYYGNIKLLIDSLEDAVRIIGYFTFDDQAENAQINEFKSVKQEMNNNEASYQVLKDFAIDNAKKEIELTTLNHRAINKDPKKIQEQIEEVENFEEDINQLKHQISALNDKKFDVVTRLKHALIKMLPELNLLDAESEQGREVQQIYQDKKNGLELDDFKFNLLKHHQWQKTIFKYIKLEGLVLPDLYAENKQDKIKVYIENYRQSGERISKKAREELGKIDKREEFNGNDELKKAWYEYKDFCRDKRNKSVELGNKKSLYNAIKREVLRQKMCNHFAVLVSDGENASPYYYLDINSK